MESTMINILSKNGKIKSIQTEILGSGCFSTAYKFNNKVYILTEVKWNGDTSLNDMSKQVMSTMRGIHIPKIKYLGIVKGYYTSCKYYCYEMPIYKPLENPKYIEISNLLHQKMFKTFDLYTNTLKYGITECAARQRDYIFQEMESELKKSDSILTRTLVNSIKKIVNACLKYADNYFMEFPMRNLMEDAKGNLILLDIVFNPTQIHE